MAMIKEPMTHNEQLRNFSRRIYSSNGIVRNTIDYMVSMPTLDYVVTSKINDSKTKVKKEIVRYVLDLINHKEIVRDSLLKDCVDAVYFYYFDTGDRPLSKKKFMSDFDIDSISEINALMGKLKNINASIISLPVDYCKIVGIKNNHFVGAFNLKYFDEGTESAENKLRKYPKEIRTAYEKRKNGHTTGDWVILDDMKTMIYKVSSNRDEPWGRPLILPAILDILYSNYFTNTKRNVLDNVNNQVFYETFPQGKEKGTSSLTGEQQKRQHNDVKSAILNKNSRGGISFFSVAAGTTIGSLQVNTDIFDDKNESGLTDKIATNLGFAASLLNASGQTSFSAQQTNLELVTSQIFQWVDGFANELNKVINYNILDESCVNVKVNYLPITHINKNSMIGFAKDLYLQGKGSLSLWASAVGLDTDVFYSMIDEDNNERHIDDLPCHQTSYTMSSKDVQSQSENKGGRPTIEETTGQPTNENTIRSKTNNSNSVPKPSKK